MLLNALIDPILQRALEEDLMSGDLSAEACVEADRQATARVYAKTPLVVAGGPVFSRVLQLVDPALQCETLVSEGRQVAASTALFRVRGPARTLLMAERTALNFLQRMSGTATLTRQCVDARAPGSNTRIADTRKTTPGLRPLERYAVRQGGGNNHRDNLGSAVMIKDNHIVAAGGIAQAVARARQRAPHTSKIEVEVKTDQELDEALSARADIIMLDNFSDDEVRLALARIKTAPYRPIIEASGGITEARIFALSLLGVDVISIGALTHSAKAADISLDFELSP